MSPSAITKAYKFFEWSESVCLDSHPLFFLSQVLVSNAMFVELPVRNVALFTLEGMDDISKGRK